MGDFSRRKSPTIRAHDPPAGRVLHARLPEPAGPEGPGPARSSLCHHFALCRLVWANDKSLENGRTSGGVANWTDSGRVRPRVSGRVGAAAWRRRASCDFTIDSNFSSSNAYL